MFGMWREASLAHRMGKQLSWPQGRGSRFYDPLGRQRSHGHLSHHQRRSNQAAGGSGSLWTPCQARGGVWDSKLARSQGPWSSLIVEGWASQNHGVPGLCKLAVRTECLVPTGVSKGLRHNSGYKASPKCQGRRRPWVVPSLTPSTPALGYGHQTTLSLTG